MQFAIESNQTMTEIMDELFQLCDALPSVGPTQGIVDCARIPSMPKITFSLPDADLTLTAEQYVLKVRTAFECIRPYCSERSDSQSWNGHCCRAAAPFQAVSEAVAHELP